MRAIPSFLLAGLAVLACGCVWTDPGSEAQAEAVPLPAGDIEDGRRAFLAHGCALCHGATRESAFPAPATENAGPAIGRPQDGWTGYEIAQAIIDPAHEVPPEFRETRVVANGTSQSPMAEYADVLTIQDIADLIAYVRYLGE